MLDTSLGRFVIDPYRIPVKNVTSGDVVGKTLIGNINATIYMKHRKRPLWFAGPVAMIKSYFVSWYPLNSQWPVAYEIRRDWNAPLEEA